MFNKFAYVFFIVGGYKQRGIGRIYSKEGFWYVKGF